MPKPRPVFVAVALLALVGCDDEPAKNRGAPPAERGQGAQTPPQRPQAEGFSTEVFEGEFGELKAEFDAGDDIKISCAFYLGRYRQLADSSDPAEAKAWSSFDDLCHVQQVERQLQALRAALEAHAAGEKLEHGEGPVEISSDLEIVLGGPFFPEQGKAAELAAEARTLLDVEVPIVDIEARLAINSCMLAKGAAGGKREALAADERGKAVLERLDRLCPDDE